MQRNVPVLPISKRASKAVTLIEAGAPAVGVIDSAGRHIGLVTWPNLMDRMTINTALESRVRARRKGSAFLSGSKEWPNVETLCL